MKGIRVCAALLLAAIVCLMFIPSDGRAGADLTRIRAWRCLWLEDKSKRLCFMADETGGFKFRMKKKKVAGEKRR
jgi:hypothetical protein